MYRSVSLQWFVGCQRPIWLGAAEIRRAYFRAWNAGSSQIDGLEWPPVSHRAQRMLLRKRLEVVRAFLVTRSAFFQRHRRCLEMDYRFHVHRQSKPEHVSAFPLTTPLRPRQYFSAKSFAFVPHRKPIQKPSIGTQRHPRAFKLNI